MNDFLFQNDQKHINKPMPMSIFHNVIRLTKIYPYDKEYCSATQMMSSLHIKPHMKMPISIIFPYLLIFIILTYFKTFFHHILMIIGYFVIRRDIWEFYLGLL